MKDNIKKRLKKIYFALFLGKWCNIPYGITMSASEKYRLLSEFQQRFALETLVETGTYTGGTVEACRPFFKKLYSVELNLEMWQKAKDRFANDINVEIIQGDSAQVLETIVPKVSERTLYWLDAHYCLGQTSQGSLDTPILSELKTIFNSPYKNCYILIDDARCFIGWNDYPRVNFLEKMVRKQNSDLVFEVKDDVIRIYPGKKALSDTH